MTTNPDSEPLPLEATAPLLDAVQEPIRRIHDLLDEVEQHARDWNQEEAIGALLRASHCVGDAIIALKGVR